MLNKSLFFEQLYLTFRWLHTVATFACVHCTFKLFFTTIYSIHDEINLFIEKIYCFFILDVAVQVSSSLCYNFFFVIYCLKFWRVLRFYKMLNGQNVCNRPKLNWTWHMFEIIVQLLFILTFKRFISMKTKNIFV